MGAASTCWPATRASRSCSSAATSSEPPVSESRRAVVLVNVTRVADSCGYGVPLMAYEGQRPHQEASSSKRLRTKGPEGFRDYQRENNAESLDGLPAVELPAGG